MLKIEYPVRNKPNIQYLLKRSPSWAVDIFTEERLKQITLSLAGGRWGRHKLNIRRTVFVFTSRSYFVLLNEKNKRGTTLAQRTISKFSLSVLLLFVTLACSLSGLLLLYILKSWLGINLFQNFSLGIWDLIK